MILIIHLRKVAQLICSIGKKIIFFEVLILNYVVSKDEIGLVVARTTNNM